MISLSPDREALTVAMALVPGMYPRNRLFALHREPEVRRARARAAMIRGVVRQLAGERGEADGIALVRHGEVSILRYRVPQVSFERHGSSFTRRSSGRASTFSASRWRTRRHIVTTEERSHIDCGAEDLGAELPPVRPRCASCRAIGRRAETRQRDTLAAHEQLSFLQDRVRKKFPQKSCMRTIMSAFRGRPAR